MDSHSWTVTSGPDKPEIGKKPLRMDWETNILKSGDFHFDTFRSKLKERNMNVLEFTIPGVGEFRSVNNLM